MQLKEDDVLRYVAATAAFCALPHQAPSSHNKPGVIASVLLGRAIQTMLSAPFPHVEMESTRQTLLNRVYELTGAHLVPSGAIERNAERDVALAAAYITQTVGSAMAAYGGRGEAIGLAILRGLRQD